jgi:pimeloyl-ACP methyl ester carboxylesterase
MLLLRIVLLLAVSYAGAVLWMWARQERYLFLPKHYEVLPEFERFRWDRNINGIRHQGWFLDKGKEKTVIYHGGNAEDLAGHCEVMMDGLDANALLVNYRGYGQSEGTPGEKEMVADCIAVFDLFCAEKNVSPSNIFLMGRSLGSGIAIQVAAARPAAAGLILVTPYESIEAIARVQYPWLPAKGILRHPFLAIDYAPQIQMRALVLLAEFDEAIPIETGRRLGEALGGPTEIITLPMGHMDINEHYGYFGAINAFVNGPAR